MRYIAIVLLFATFLALTGARKHGHRHGHSKHKKHKHHKGSVDHTTHPAKVDYATDCSGEYVSNMEKFVAKDPAVFNKFKVCYVEMLTCLDNLESKEDCSCMTTMMKCSLEDFLKNMAYSQKQNMDTNAMLDDNSNRKRMSKRGKKKLRQIKKTLQTLRKGANKIRGKKMKKIKKMKKMKMMKKKISKAMKHMIKKKWSKKMPRVLAKVIWQNNRCVKNLSQENENDEGDNKCSSETFECFDENLSKTKIIIHQICAHQLTHCDKTPTECDTEWRKCLQPDATKSAITVHSDIDKCRDNSVSDVKKCLLEANHELIPTPHCRQKMCCEHVNGEENAETDYENCMMRQF